MEKLNDRQRRFAELIVAGQSAKAAYFEAFPRCRSEKTAEAEGSRLSKNPKVAAFIDSLRWEISENTKSNLVADKQEVLEFLTNVIRTAPGNIDEENPLCQSFKHTQAVREIKLPDKLKAAERLCKILGFDAAEKHEVNAGDDLKALLLELRKGGKPELE